MIGGMRMKRGKMGRPPLPPAKRRIRRVYVPLTGAELRRLAGEAKAGGLTLAVALARPWRAGKGGQ